MWKDVGARYVIVGHSERRPVLLQRPDEQVNRKTHAGIAGRSAVISASGDNAQTSASREEPKRCFYSS
jgi:triosephosphate isomerase